MNALKDFLKKWPNFYHLLQRVYYAFYYVVEAHVFGSKTQEWIWKTRHKFKSDKWTQECIETRNHPRRHLILERIASFIPVQSIMEIGCSSGANLYLLAKEYPEVKLYGIDINAIAIKEGNAFFKKQGMINVHLFVHKADKLEQFADKSIDVIFTDATLMYIGSDKIRKVIKEVRRISRKGFIFSEWHCEDNSREYLWYYGHWIYNYKSLLANFFSSDNITISRHPEGFWDDDTWSKFGSIIEVRL
jgi:ubiquinone/menaquinone biosynthesis C-methylase UbiE